MPSATATALEEPADLGRVWASVRVRVRVRVRVGLRARVRVR